jgi:hypothetical protein
LSQRGYFRFPFPFPFALPVIFAAAWLTFTVFPATMTVVVRDAPVLAGTETVAVPLAEPEPATVAHEADEDAQEHPLAVETVTLADPVVAVKLSDVGDTE